jgi:hypothetical protein
VGTWKRETAHDVTFETWRAPSGRTLEGEAHAESKETGERRLTESLLLVAMGGEIYYIPRPAESPLPVAFRLTAHTSGRAVFENPAHDFPKKIVYQKNADGSMTASLEGPGPGGQPLRRIDFHFTRVP